MTTYERICRERCQWCVKDFLTSHGHTRHWDARTGVDVGICTAPTRDELIEQQAKRIAELEAARGET